MYYSKYNSNKEKIKKNKEIQYVEFNQRPRN